jgi:hypothetical protein
MRIALLLLLLGNMRSEAGRVDKELNTTDQLLEEMRCLKTKMPNSKCSVNCTWLRSKCTVHTNYII